MKPLEPTITEPTGDPRPLLKQTLTESQSLTSLEAGSFKEVAVLNLKERQANDLKCFLFLDSYMLTVGLRHSAKGASYPCKLVPQHRSSARELHGLRICCANFQCTPKT